MLYYWHEKDLNVTWWDWELSGWLSFTLRQCFDTVCWAIRHVNIFSSICVERDIKTARYKYQVWRNKHGKNYIFDSLPSKGTSPRAQDFHSNICLPVIRPRHTKFRSEYLLRALGFTLFTGCPFPSLRAPLLPPVLLPSPSPVFSEVDPLNTARVSRGASLAGRILCILALNLTSGGNDFTTFPENYLITFLH